MDRGSFGDLLLVMNTALPASGDHLGRTLGDLTHGQRSELPRYNNISGYDHWNSQLTKFLKGTLITLMDIIVSWMFTFHPIIFKNLKMLPL